MPLGRVEDHWSSTNALIGSKVFSSVHDLDNTLSLFFLTDLKDAPRLCYLSYTIPVIAALKSSLDILQNLEETHRS